MRKLKIFSYFCLSLVMIIGLMTVVASGGGGGGGSDTPDDTIDPYEITPSSITTFDYNGGDICMEDGKPVIRMFSSPTCPHCTWAADAFDPVAKMYVNEGAIVAHHWDLITGDDLLTSVVETEIPDSEMAIYNTYSGGYVPTFVFGCTYSRVGTGFESTDDLEAEATEYMAVIEELLDSVP